MNQVAPVGGSLSVRLSVCSPVQPAWLNQNSNLHAEVFTPMNTKHKHETREGKEEKKVSCQVCKAATTNCKKKQEIKHKT